MAKIGGVMRKHEYDPNSSSETLGQPERKLTDFGRIVGIEMFRWTNRTTYLLPPSRLATKSHVFNAHVICLGGAVDRGSHFTVTRYAAEIHRILGK